MRHLTNVRIDRVICESNTALSKIYYLDCNELFGNVLRNNLSTDSLLPVGLYQEDIDIKLHDSYTLPIVLNYRILGSDGSITSDIVCITLCITYE